MLVEHLLPPALAVAVEQGGELRDEKGLVTCFKHDAVTVFTRALVNRFHLHGVVPAGDGTTMFLCLNDECISINTSDGYQVVAERLGSSEELERWLDVEFHSFVPDWVPLRIKVVRDIWSSDIPQVFGLSEVVKKFTRTARHGAFNYNGLHR